MIVDSIDRPNIPPTKIQSTPPNKLSKLAPFLATLGSLDHAVNTTYHKDSYKLLHRVSNSVLLPRLLSTKLPSAKKERLVIPALKIMDMKLRRLFFVLKLVIVLTNSRPVHVQ